MIRSYQALINRILLLLDTCTLSLAFLLALIVKFKTHWFDSVDVIGPQAYMSLGVLIVPVFLCTNAIFGLYTSSRTRRLRVVFSQIAKSAITTLLIVMSVLFFIKEIHVSRAMLAFFMMLAFLFLASERIGLRMVLQRIRSMGYNKKFMLVIGAGHLGRKVLQIMGDHREFGFQIIGFLDDNLFPATPKVDGIDVLGRLDNLEQILNNLLIDQVILALPIDAYPRLDEIIATCEKIGVQTLIIPDYFNYLPARPRFEEVGGIPMIDVRYVPLDNVMNAVLKRAFDLAFSLTVLAVLAPVFLLLAIGVKCSSSGPILFMQERVGKNRRTFQMYKFRTMRVSSDAVSNTQWTTQNDERKTKFGSLLRKTSLDELPQFINVLKGDMSIIGPRPERPHFVDQFKNEIPKYMVKHRVRPGITGWAQINGWRGDTSIHERIKCDIDYIENWSFVFDLKIVMKTIINGLVNKNAY